MFNSDFIHNTYREFKYIQGFTDCGLILNTMSKFKYVHVVEGIILNQLLQQNLEVDTTKYSI